MEPLRIGRRSVRLPIVVFTLLAAAGCSIDYESGTFSENLSEEIPDTVLLSFTHTVVRGETPLFRITAERAESFDTKKETRLTDVSFREYDADGTVITEGVADSAVFFTDTENARIEGNIRVTTHREDGSLSAERLSWDSEERLLAGEPEDEVEIERETGSQVRGRDFRADLRRRVITFGSSVDGIYRSGEKTDEAP